MKILIFGLLLPFVFPHEELVNQRDQIFAQYDQNGDEILSKEELMAGLSKDMNFPESSNMVEETASKMLQQSDADGNGLEKDELLSLLGG